MKATALISFNAFNIAASNGDVIEFTDQEQMQQLLKMGWIKPIQEKKAAATSSKKNPLL